ncbi:uncharacterized protein TrAtP1_011262 [Trichoderma atroviride]|uniref:Uncharacterized protein n=1 Tax=Hypocrea atroviridis (strain ATCC 20476 / IMI 206040) TaxID=452589 RepID=G9NFK2_HYPAI|nr:uncharacterized protein TRIATDRAFT_303649 [Trichoderma atroviride IMI 206040]EHK50717.1 hypothetical protein TRIATDRAFT_303649 [Trichoderma atroviride IMI 206040]UKZ70269.1 hypothetical protein TrAtP1_011262 [Trichoderma atroviride]
MQFPSISVFGRDPPSERSIAAATNKANARVPRRRGCGAHEDGAGTRRKTGVVVMQGGTPSQCWRAMTSWSKHGSWL